MTKTRARKETVEGQSLMGQPLEPPRSPAMSEQGKKARLKRSPDPTPSIIHQKVAAYLYGLARDVRDDEAREVFQRDARERAAMARWTMEHYFCCEQRLRQLGQHPEDPSR